MKLRLLLVALVSLVVCAWVSSAAPQGIKKGPEAVAPGGAKPDDKPIPDDKATPDPKGEPAKESPRLVKLRQLQYDRKPSSTLKAWAAPAVDDAAKEKKLDPLDLELRALQRQVTLGNWPAVKYYFEGLPEEEARVGYKQMLQSLQASPIGPVAMGPGGPLPPHVLRFFEKNTFSADDIVGLAGASPHKLDRDLLAPLGNIVKLGLENNLVVENVVARLKKEIDLPAGKAALSKRQAAQLLFAAGETVEAGVFLPSLEQASKDDDYEALNLLARHYQGLYAKEKKVRHLEQAWAVTQATLAAKDLTRVDKEDALKRAVELAPKIKDELGQTWLDESFTRDPQRGMDILATIGATVAQGLQTTPMAQDLRLKALQLQKTAVEALVRAAPDKAGAWRGSLALLAGCWLKEAEFSQAFGSAGGVGQRMHRDRFGNIYFLNEEMYGPMMYQQQQNMPRAIGVGDVLECRPGEKWIEQLDDGLRPKLSITFAHLFLKVGDEDKAFPFIEGLAQTHTEKARELVHEFLRVWTRNHDPNESRRYTNPYMFMYGFERRSESIPLTRSKQERNLVELAGWVRRLRGLNVGDIDEELLAKAFTTSHSSAEVYRLEAIEKVFGSIDSLKPKTLAGLAQQMRENLSGLWREPAVQKDKKTNRKTKDIQAEVLRGYSLARAVTDNSLKKFPDEWSLHLAKAALLFDENNYLQEVAKSSDYSRRREEALGLFRRAAELYARHAKDLAEDQETTRAYEQWFYASLGACDLQHVSEEKLPDLRQPALIRAAILGLPGESAERHLAKFANTLFTRLSAVGPAVKHRYLRGGFDIVGDHKQAHEAKKVFDYYKDLVREIKLEAVVDGPDGVGQQPFGEFVNLRHTREIERESGGFGRYLQNQNTGMYWAYNYGRPTADYRDKFQAIVKEALQESFEVLSVTFQSDKVNSRAVAEYGWRYTPYAYLLLKARGPQVDKIAPLRLDLDFLETSGYVILPIESPALPIDAAAKAPSRPVRKLQVTQTLDERQADQGKLILEVKATGLGLVPSLEEVVAVEQEGFDITKTDDQGVSVARFDPDSEQNVVVSERTWLVTLKAKPGQQAPREFRFAAAKSPAVEMTYQRYEDADLKTAEAVVALDREYGAASRAWLWIVGGSVLALVAIGVALWLLFRRAPVLAARLALPTNLTPFSVMALLQHIGANNGLGDQQQAELRHSLQVLERQYFADDGSGSMDLRKVAEDWLRKAQ